MATATFCKTRVLATAKTRLADFQKEAASKSSQIYTCWQILSLCQNCLEETVTLESSESFMLFGVDLAS